MALSTGLKDSPRSKPVDFSDGGTHFMIYFQARALREI